MAQAIVALVAIVVGVKVGFLFAKRPRVLPNLPKMGALYYGLAGAIGFVLSALWASEGGSTWPLIVWFLPAAVLESFSSSAALASKRNAS